MSVTTYVTATVEFTMEVATDAWDDSEQMARAFKEGREKCMSAIHGTNDTMRRHLLDGLRRTGKIKELSVALKMKEPTP